MTDRLPRVLMIALAMMFLSYIATYFLGTHVFVDRFGASAQIYTFDAESTQIVDRRIPFWARNSHTAVVAHALYGAWGMGY